MRQQVHKRFNAVIEHRAGRLKPGLILCGAQEGSQTLISRYFFRCDAIRRKITIVSKVCARRYDSPTHLSTKTTLSVFMKL